MNNVCSERISLTYQTFAFIHLFTCCGRAWMKPVLSAPQQSLGSAIRLFHLCFVNVGFFRIGKVNETDSAHKGKAKSKLGSGIETLPVPLTESRVPESGKRLMKRPVWTETTISFSRFLNSAT